MGKKNSFRQPIKCTVEYVSNGEKSNVRDTKIEMRETDWEEFWHLFISWFVCGLVIFIVLIVLTMAVKSENLLEDMIMRIDTISLVFSLVLSACLEQIWNIKKNWKYKFSQIAEIFLAITGLIMYLVYSLWDIYEPNNLYYQKRFMFNLIYIFLSFACVIIGFWMRARIEE